MKSILSVVLLNEEAVAGLQCLWSMKLILNKIFRTSAGQISAKKKMIINVLMACILNKANNTISTAAMGKDAGLSKHCISYNKAKLFQKARLIQADNETGIELVAPEKSHSKFSLESVV